MWPDLANNGYPIEFEFQTNNELVFSIIGCHAIFGTNLYCKLVHCFLKFTCNWHPVFYMATLPKK